MSPLEFHLRIHESFGNYYRYMNRLFLRTKMKLVIGICLLSIVAAEPPVSESYSAPRTSYDQSIGSAPQRTISQEYGPPQPSRRRNTLSSEYGLPSAKSGSKLSSSYGLPSPRISHEYGAPNTRPSLSESLSKDSVGYTAPRSQNSPSETYRAPSTRSGLYQGSISPQGAQSYAPNYSPSSQYGAPENRILSKQYGLPSPRQSSSRPSQKLSLRNQLQTKQVLSQEYGVPSNRINDISQSYNAPKISLKSHSSQDLQQSYGAPKTSQIHHNARLPSFYGVPDSIITTDYSQDVKPISQTYGEPSGRDLSETYGAPPTGNSFEPYRAQSKSTGLKTNAVSASYSYGRSSLSAKYGAPSVSDSMPSDNYGVPEQYNALANGYGYARNSLDDHDNEPASYDFGYKVIDYISGSDFGHTESRQDNRAEGTYFVVLPDGNRQVVEYEADERGFKPRISVEPAEGSALGGYDVNASDLAKSEDGPY